MTDTEKNEKIKKLINDIAEYYGEPDEEQVEEMRKLTGVEWYAEDLQMLCCGYWESPHTLDELVYFLIHEEWPQKGMLTLSDLEFSNKKFWTCFVATSFPTALDEETDMSLSELIEENKAADIDWWRNFTKYYDGVLEETDGYIDEPETLICDLTATQTLKIEFHPGDTVYYINDRQIACTGGEYNIQIFPLADLLKYIEEKPDKRILLLLLPLTIISNQDIDHAMEIISNVLQEIFDKHLCDQFANSIIYGLMEE